MTVLFDAVDALVRIKISGQIAAEVAALSGTGVLERVKIAGRIAALLAQLGEGEVPATETITLTGQEFGEHPDTPEGLKTLRDAAFQHYLNELVPMGGIFCRALDVQVEFNKRGLKKFASMSGDRRKIKIVAALPELIATGRKTSEMAPSDKAARSGVTKAFVLKADVSIGGEAVTARIIVHERADGTFTYDHSVDKSEAVKVTGGSSGALDSVVSTEQGRSVLQPNEASLGRDLHRQDLMIDQDEDGDNALDSVPSTEVLNLFLEGEEIEQAPFAVFEPQADGSLIVRGDAEALTAAIKAIGGKPRAVAGGVRLTAGEARLREYIPVRIEQLQSGAQLEYHESGTVGVRGDFRGGYMGAAAKLSELELYFAQDYDPEEFERVFGKPAPAEGVALYRQEQAEIAARTAANAARADEQRIDYAKKSGNWAQLSAEERAALKAESDALTAEFEQKQQAEWEATTGAGVSSNPRYQAYLDTLEDIPAIGRIMVQVGYMAWIQQRLADHKATGAGHMPYINGPARDEWQRKATAFVREWADQHLSARVRAQRALAAGRAPAGGTLGMNGEFYKGGSFLPNTALPKQDKAAGGVGGATGVLIEPGVRADAPAPGYGSIFANYREFIDVTSGVASVFERPDAAVAAYVNEDVAEGRAFLRAAAEAYNAGMRWYKPGEIEVRDEHRADAEAPAFEVIEHTTGRGKVIRGIVRTDLSYAEAKAIDEYTFKKNGGYFIREKHLEAMGLPPAPAVPDEPVDPIRQAELDAEREQQRLQAEADRLANEQARQRQKLEQQVSKLRSVAASTLEKAEQEIGRDRLANTSRRAAMAASGIAAAERSRALALTMNNLADAIERGQAQHLAGISSRADVETLTERLNGARYEYERAKGISSMDRERRKHDPITAEEARYATFPDPKWDSAGARRSAILDMLKGKRGGPAIADKIRYASSMTAEQVKALRDLLGKKEVDAELGWWNVEQLAKVERLKRAGITNTLELRDALAEFLEFREGARAEDPIAKAERAIIGQKVGIDFFPTPKALAARMADLAGVGDGDRVLEPSAGNGNLADAAKAAGGQVDVIEISSQLRDILTAKGYEVVAHDFDAFTPSEPYDAVIMNPPFSNRRDAEHIMRAFGMLKAGGRLVAIAGEGVFFGTDAKAVAFRKWLDDHGADIEPLGAGTFKDTSLLATTGANARLIVIRK